MKTMRLLLAVAIITLANSAFAQSKTAFNIDDSKIALEGYSPVSYLDLNLAQRGDKDISSEHAGVKYFFVDAEQKKKFEANPGRYLPQYGGFCATGIAVGAKFRTDPNKFLVENGKLYLFLNSIEVDAKQLWMADKKGMSAKANKNWPKLKAKH